MAKSKVVITPEFRVSYPKVFKPEPNKLKNNELEYSMQALFPKGADLSTLKKAAQEALQEKFGARLPQLVKEGKLKTPFRDQGEKEYTRDDGVKVMPPAMEKGAIFLTLRTKQKPGVVDQNVQSIMNEADFYGGCYAKAAVTVYAYEKGSNCGVNFGLQHVQKTRDGESLGSRTRAEDAFAPIDTPATGGSADAGGLFD